MTSDERGIDEGTVTFDVDDGIGQAGRDDRLEIDGPTETSLPFQRGGASVPEQVDPVANETELTTIGVRHALPCGLGLAPRGFVDEPQQRSGRHQDHEDEKKRNEPRRPVVARGAESDR